MTGTVNKLRLMASSMKCLRLPSLSPSMTSARINKWHVTPGKQVKEYDLVTSLDVSALTKLGDEEGCGDVTSMLLELQEDMIVGRILEGTDGKQTPLCVGTPLLLLCECQDSYDMVSAEFNLLIHSIMFMCYASYIVVQCVYC